jgi:uncharacterized protein (TIGR00661 family)
LPEVKWQVFSKHQQTTYEYRNVVVQQINNESFNKSLENCAGLFTGGGFEGPAEALYLGKKVLMMPMKNQFEQSCNAAAAAGLGLPIIKQIDENLVNKLRYWIGNDEIIKVDFPDETEQIVANLVNKFGGK